MHTLVRALARPLASAGVLSRSIPREVRADEAGPAGPPTGLGVLGEALGPAAALRLPGASLRLSLAPRGDGHVVAPPEHHTQVRVGGKRRRPLRPDESDVQTFVQRLEEPRERLVRERCRGARLRRACSHREAPVQCWCCAPPLRGGLGVGVWP